jgi:NAD(P)-dependent dehydrogenase (short-subunit alcohol dehydrogenase family)
MRVAIAGGHGQIALRLAKILSKRGDEVVAAFERRANNLLAQANAYRDLSSSLALDSDASVPTSSS